VHSLLKEKNVSLVNPGDLTRKGNESLAQKKYEVALSYYLSAKEILDLKKANGDLRYANLLTNIGNMHAVRNRPGLAIVHYERARLLLHRLKKSKTRAAAVLYFNYGTALEQAKDYKNAVLEFGKARVILADANLRNSVLYNKVLLQEGNALARDGSLKEAAQAYSRVISALYILDDRKNELYAAAHFNRAITNKDEKAAASDYRIARLTYGRLGLKARAADARNRLKTPHRAAFASSFHPPVKNSLGLTPAEERLVRSYTGAFRFSEKIPSLQRTYGGRQADTNIFLRDLLDSSRNEAALAALRKRTLTSGMNKAGKGLFFVDIGPAVGNIYNPAPTSASLARDFGEMPVVALDLPYAVKKFLRQASGKSKYSLVKYKNVHVFSGNGLKSLSAQFKDKERWVLKDRAVPDVSRAELIIVRAANSIDIYVPWKGVRPALELMASDFKTRNLLLLFNRTILFKPKNSIHYSVIGILSMRGFHHNKLSYNRLGQPPYVLREF